MRYRIYAKTDGVEGLVYDSESGLMEEAVASPQLKLELSKAGSLDFTIFQTHPMYGSFKKMTTYVRVLQDEEEIYRGRVLKIEDSTYKERKIQCEGDLAYLVDSLQPPQQSSSSNTTTTPTKTNTAYRTQYGSHATAKTTTTQKLTLGEVSNTSSTLANQFTSYINQHNSMVDAEKQFTVGVVTVTADGAVEFSEAGYRDSSNAITSDLINQFGGYLQTRKNPNGPTYIDWLKEPQANATQPLTLGVNIIDLQRNEEGDEFFTVYVPIGDDNLTIASVNNSKIGLEDAEGIAEYGYIYKVESYSGITSAAELKKLAEAYMAAHYKPDKHTLSIKAIDMHLLDGSIDAIQVGTNVTVVSEPHSIEETLCCLSIEYDIQNPDNNSYEIGDVNETFSRKNNKHNKQAASATRSASRSASRANDATDTLETTVNRHADNILDTADLLYKVEADLVQVHAKCIEITATEKVTVTCDDLEVNASGKINMQAGGTFTVKSGGDITMESGTKLNFNNTVYIGNNNLPSPGSHTSPNLLAIGDSYFQKVEIGGNLYISRIEDEDSGVWSTDSLTGFLNMSSAQFTYTGGGSAQYLEDGVKSFGAGSVDASGTVRIPYYTFSGQGQGTINFDMAATKFFTDSMAAEYQSGYSKGYGDVTISGLGIEEGTYQGETAYRARVYFKDRWRYSQWQTV